MFLSPVYRSLWCCGFVFTLMVLWYSIALSGSSLSLPAVHRSRTAVHLGALQPGGQQTQEPLRQRHRLWPLSRYSGSNWRSGSTKLHHPQTSPIHLHKHEIHRDYIETQTNFDLLIKSNELLIMPSELLIKSSELLDQWSSESNELLIKSSSCRSIKSQTSKK